VLEDLTHKAKLCLKFNHHHVNDHAKIVDFGLASPIGGCSDEFPGTAFYMAPEQIEGDPVDPRTDIYSLGIMAYEMATGRRPYSDDVCEVLKAHITEPIPYPRVLNPDLPETFCRFITKATQKDPRSRYDDLLQVSDDLNYMVKNTGEFLLREPIQHRRRMMSLFILYGDDRQLELNEFLKGFSEQIKELGAELRIADLDNL